MCMNFGFVPYIFISFCFLYLINESFFGQFMDLFVAYKHMEFIIPLIHLPR